VAEVHGNHGSTGLTVLHSLTGEKEQVPLPACNILSARQPRTEWLGDMMNATSAVSFLSGRTFSRGKERPRGRSIANPGLLRNERAPEFFVVGDGAPRFRQARLLSGCGGRALSSCSSWHQYLAKVQ